MKNIIFNFKNELVNWVWIFECICYVLIINFKFIIKLNNKKFVNFWINFTFFDIWNWIFLKWLKLFWWHCVWNIGGWNVQMQQTARSLVAWSGGTQSTAGNKGFSTYKLKVRATMAWLQGLTIMHSTQSLMKAQKGPKVSIMYA